MRYSSGQTAIGRGSAAHIAEAVKGLRNIIKVEYRNLRDEFMIKSVQVSQKPDKNAIIAILRDKMPYLREHYNVSEIGLFGSYVRGEADDKSDIDIIVSLFHSPVLRG